MHPTPTALVTGGSRGIGRGICLALAARGYAIAVNYTSNEDAAKQTQTLLNPQVDSMLCRADVGVAIDREVMVRNVIARWDRIDVLVNNAGITSVGRRDILEATEESWDRVMEVNLKGPYFLTRDVANEMVRLQSQLVTPTIINITSLSAYVTSTNRGDYCISKAGMSMMTQLYAVRLAEAGIRVFEVRPGVIDTDMTAGVHDIYQQRISDGLSPIRRFGTPTDVGAAVALLATGELPFSTGDVLHVDGGFHLRRL